VSGGWLCLVLTFHFFPVSAAFTTTNSTSAQDVCIVFSIPSAQRDSIGCCSHDPFMPALLATVVLDRRNATCYLYGYISGTDLGCGVAMVFLDGFGIAGRSVRGGCRSGIPSKAADAMA
jgi:hypothetical protein